MVFGFQKIMDFAMDIVKLNLANLPTSPKNQKPYFKTKIT